MYSKKRAGDFTNNEVSQHIFTIFECYFIVKTLAAFVSSWSIGRPVLQEPQNEISLYIYVVVTLCAVGLLVASVLAMFTANSLYKRHRIRKQMNKAFQV